jgi:hypothetical protein
MNHNNFGYTLTLETVTNEQVAASIFFYDTSCCVSLSFIPNSELIKSFPDHGKTFMEVKQTEANLPYQPIS